MKLYLPEPGSDELNRLVEGRVDLLVSDLAVTEAASALQRRNVSPRSEVIENFAEIERNLSGTRFQHFLSDRPGPPCD